MVCKKCGMIVPEGRQNCLSCGTPVEGSNSDVKKCSVCGVTLTPGSDTCPGCGTHLSKRVESPKLERTNSLPITVKAYGLIDKSVLDGSAKSVLKAHQILALAMFVIMFALYFVPVFRFEVDRAYKKELEMYEDYYDIDVDFDELSFSLGNPLGNENISDLLFYDTKKSEVEDIKNGVNLYLAIIYFIPIAFAFAITAIPLISNGLVKRRRMFWQKWVAIASLLGFFAMMLLMKMISIEAEGVNVVFTFGGWAMLIFQIVFIVFLFYASGINKALMENEYLYE